MNGNMARSSGLANPAGNPQIPKSAASPARNRLGVNNTLQKINLGCGPVQPEGWINVDGSNRAWLATRLGFLDRLLTNLRLLSPTEFGAKTTYARLEKKLPWPDNSVDAVYMGEVLEHFTRSMGQHLVQEIFRILRPGGIIRLRVPDNARFWENYLQDYHQVRKKPRDEWTTEHTRWIEMFFRDICVENRRFASMGHYHKWMFDEVSLIKLLEEIGFKDVQRKPFLDSRLEGIEKVEARDDLIVEAIKP